MDFNEKLKEMRPDPQPSCDWLKCSACGWEGSINEGVEVREGDWESGYYTAHDCPQCLDGGEIEYEMTRERSLEWEAWWEQKHA